METKKQEATIQSPPAHPKMPLDRRAKQFLPFVAQPGLYEALEAEAQKHERHFERMEQREEP